MTKFIAKADAQLMLQIWREVKAISAIPMSHTSRLPAFHASLGMHLKAYQLNICESPWFSLWIMNSRCKYAHMLDEAIHRQLVPTKSGSAAQALAKHAEKHQRISLCVAAQDAGLSKQRTAREVILVLSALEVLRGLLPNGRQSDSHTHVYELPGPSLGLHSERLRIPNQELGTGSHEHY